MADDLIWRASDLGEILLDPNHPQRAESARAVNAYMGEHPEFRTALRLLYGRIEAIDLTPDSDYQPHDSERQRRFCWAIEHDAGCKELFARYGEHLTACMNW